MPPIAIDLTPPPPPPPELENLPARPRFSNLRAVRWRINLGILPCSPLASVEDLRRVAADSRRRYASQRRRLLIDPHLSMDGSRSSNPAKDNPLSQNPDSIWGQFFRNAELEKMVDQDLSRLYPEHSSYFQRPVCQTMLRRILLLWCLRHPEYGYRQGMHELLAPLLYVLHVDLQHLSEVQGQYEDYFNDEFDETSFPERELVSHSRVPRTANIDANTDDESFKESTVKSGSLDELDPDTRDIILLSDAYGAEGELGVILSERFIEHDAYCMFDSLMSGARGVVAMADFFSPSPATGSSAGVPPVIEASSSLYHLLSFVDSSLHRHLVELGVEPQYFALRWLRVLFGREFSLDDLLVIWDELFSCSNNTCIGDGIEYSFRILCSPRGAFISAMAVSMLLHVRSSLFATENATSCLQRLLNFPKNIDLKKLIEKARSLQPLALDTNIPSSSQGTPNKNNPALGRVYSLSSGSASPKAPLYLVPDSYWEEKWRVLHTEEALKKGSDNEKVSGRMTKGSLVGRFGLSKTESDPSPAKSASGKKNARSSVMRRLLDDLSREVVSDAALSKPDCDRDLDFKHSKQSIPVDVIVGNHFPEEQADQNITGRPSDCMAEETCLSGENEETCLSSENEEACLSGENSSEFSTATSPHSMGNDDENDANDSEKSSVTSNSFVADDDEETKHPEQPCSNTSENLLLKDSEAASTDKLGPGTDVTAEKEGLLKDRKSLSGKFQWFWKFGRGSGEGNAEKGGGSVDAQLSSNAGYICKPASSSTPDCISSGKDERPEMGDKKAGTVKNLGQSMLENIQVIESIFQQDPCQAGNILGGKGQVAAMSALKELRKISNLLSEM